MKINSLLTAGALLAVSALSSHAAIVITEVMSSSAHSGSGNTSNGDWFELTNTGGSAVNITGWSWDDNSFTPGSATFGGITSIAAGQSIIFTEETLGAEAAWISDWGLSGVTVVNLGGTVFQGLGAPGDSVRIYDNLNATVASVTFGASTAGFSFAWDTNGNSLGLSAISQNGAFQAAFDGKTSGEGPGIDIGSPGFAAIPEPSTYAALAGFAMLGIALNRRRRTNRA